MLHIVDDEEAIRDSLNWLASSLNIASTAYDSGTAFLSMLDTPFKPDAGGDCLLLDVRLPDLSGVALFDTLAARGLTQRLPVIFLTGHGDVPMAVDALKRGAFDFFEKPFNDNTLMERVRQALDASRAAHSTGEVTTRLGTLSSREQEVMKLILAGKMNKIIADHLAISMRTVEVHRARIFEKMNVKTAVELAGLLK